MFNLILRPGHTSPADVTLAEAGVLGFQVQLFAGHTDAADVILRSNVFYSVAETVGGGGPVEYVYAASGGILFAGAASISKSIVFTSFGGIVFAGTSAVSNTHVFTVSGGILFGGSSSVTITRSVVSNGGIVFGGSATTSYTPSGAVFTYTGSGGLVLLGDAAAVKVSAESQQTSGGWRFFPSRRKIVPKTFNFQPVGGIQFSGEAKVSVTRAFVSGIRAAKKYRITSTVTRAYAPKTGTKLSLRGRSRIRRAFGMTPRHIRTSAYKPIPALPVIVEHDEELAVMLSLIE